VDLGIGACWKAETILPNEGRRLGCGGLQSHILSNWAAELEYTVVAPPYLYLGCIEVCLALGAVTGVSVVPRAAKGALELIGGGSADLLTLRTWRVRLRLVTARVAGFHILLCGRDKCTKHYFRLRL